MMNQKANGMGKCESESINLVFKRGTYNGTYIWRMFAKQTNMKIVANSTYAGLIVLNGNRDENFTQYFISEFMKFMFNISAFVMCL